MPTKEELLKKYKRNINAEEVSDQGQSIALETKEPSANLSKREELLKKYSKTNEINKPKEKSYLDKVGDFWNRKGKDFWIGTPEEIEGLSDVSNNNAVRIPIAAGHGLARAGEFFNQGVRDDMRSIGEGASNLLGIPKEALPKMPEKLNYKQLYEENVGKPEGFFENLVSNATNLGAIGAVFPGAQSYTPLIGGATGEAIGQELELGPGGEAGLGIAGSIAPAIYNTLTNPRQTALNIASMFNRGQPNAAQQGITQAAARQRITPVAANVTNNPVVNKVSQLVAGKRGVGGAWVQQSDKQFADAFLKNATQNPLASYQKTVNAGKNATQELNESFARQNNAINKQYETFKNSKPKFSAEPIEIEQAVEEIRQNLGNVTNLSPEFETLFNRIETQIYDQEGNLRNLTLPELINIRSELGDLYRQSKNFIGQRRMKFSVRDSVDKVIERADPIAYQNLKKLDAEKTRLYETYSQNNIVSRVMDADTGTQAIKAIKNPEEYQQFANAMNQSKNGQHVLQDWNQAKFEELFRPMLTKSRSGQFSQQKFLDMMNDPQTAAWVEAITTPQQRQAINDLFNLSENFMMGNVNIKQLAGNSRNAPEVLKIAALGNALGQLLSGHPINAAMSITPSFLTSAFARMWSDPQFQQDLIRAAQQPNQRSIINGLRSAFKRAGLLEPLMEDRTDSEQEQQIQ